MRNVWMSCHYVCYFITNPFRLIPLSSCAIPSHSREFLVLTYDYTKQYITVRGDSGIMESCSDLNSNLIHELLMLNLQSARACREVFLVTM